MNDHNMNHMTRTLLSTAIGLALAAMVPLAQAQTGQATGSAESANTGAAATVQADAPAWTPDAVHITARRESYAAARTSTATRTDTPLIEVPQSVQVLTRTLIREQDRRTLAEALVNVSGVVGNKPEEGLLAGPLVRGFLAEIYQDGLPMYGSTQAANDPTSLVGVRQITVLKGPVSTLYGGGVGTPLGGLINVESERPDGTSGGYAGLRAGSHSTWNPYGEINVAISPTIAARVAAEYQQNDSWIDRLGGERWFVQPSVAFQLAPQTDLLVQLQSSRRNGLEYSGLPAAQALAGRLDRNAFPGAPLGQRDTVVRNEMATMVLRHAFSERTRLNVSARYYQSEVPQFGSFVYPDLYPADPATPTVYPILPLNMQTEMRERTLDANLTTDANLLGGRHAFLFGVNVDNTGFYSDMGFSGATVGAIDLAHPVYDLAFGPYTPPGVAQTDSYRTIAAYAQDQATYGRLHLTASLRYTQLRFRERELGTDETWRKVSPRIGATFDLAPGVALYAGYATAFRGAFGLVSLDRPQPERSRNVEAGLKFALRETGLSGTVAAFQQTRANVATPSTENPLFSVQAGEQRARGVEADLVWEPTSALSLLATYAYTQAEVTRDNVITIGDRLARVPRHNGRLAARYRVRDGAAKGLSFGAGITAFSERELTLPNTVAVPGHALVDAQASYQTGRYTFSLSALNLANRKVFDTYQYFAFPVVMPVQPRSVFVAIQTEI
ncbi:TonB-dependent siderophore receptor [Massilia sp.]|uniref:TonB-dependent siderophore receptor n=1 Tax=Massilia sp. TaxID=1882437 RepID=UPI00289906B6|nr:TonB-dependent siderophore receptor [Massilia sp.]